MRLISSLALIVCGVLSMNEAQAASSNRNYCISKCFATWNCYDDSSRMSCEQSRNLCVADCATIPDDPQHVSGGAFGAIAYGKQSGAWGLAEESPTPEAAKKSALGYCEKRGKDCVIAETFSNTCVAVAMGTDGAVDWDKDQNLRQASMNAIKKCSLKTKSGTRCFLNLRHCFFK